MKILTQEEEHGFDTLVTVVSQHGHCGAGCQVGDQTLFSANRIEGKVCIHALGTLLPTIKALRYGATFPWLEDPDVAQEACPDAANPVIFEIRRLRR